MTFDLLTALVAGGAIALFGLYALRSRQMRPADVRVRRLAERPAATRRGLSWDEIRRRGPSSLPLLRNILSDSEWSAGTTKRLEQAGLRLRIGEYMLARFAAALVAFVLVWYLILLGLERRGIVFRV